MSEPDKTLGESLTIEDVLASIPHWQGRITRFQPVGGGISNVNWRVWVDDEPGTFFVKIPGRGTELFINRDVSLEASLKAEAVGIGPRVHRLNTPHGVEVVDFIEGYQAASNRDFLRPTVREAVVRTYRKLHDSGLLSQTKTVFDMIEEHCAQIQQVGAILPDRVLGLMEYYTQARLALEAAGMDLVPCFNDPMPGSFLLGAADDLILIDYEYASNNDRCYDLGAWSTEMFFDQAAEREIIEAYFGTFDQRMFNRMTVYKVLADIKWTLWAMLQNTISTLDFDFYKYGVWKQIRARSIIDDPRWPHLLKDL